MNFKRTLVSSFTAAVTGVTCTVKILKGSHTWGDPRALKFRAISLVKINYKKING